MINIRNNKKVVSHLQSKLYGVPQIDSAYYNSLSYLSPVEESGRQVVKHVHHLCLSHSNLFIWFWPLKLFKQIINCIQPSLPLITHAYVF